MADITTISVTLRGTVNGRVVSLTANGSPVTLNPNHTYTHNLVLPVGSTHLTVSVSLTTVDSAGLSETRVALVEREDVPLAFAAPG